jgi:formamidopyrimidine-DNA glycosylase
MPELPEVETVVRGLYEDVVGRTFTAVATYWPRQIAPLSPQGFASRLTGRCVYSLHRRAKYIVFDLDEGALLIHLKMTGRLYVVPKEALHPSDRWLRAAFDMDNGYQLRFSDPRRFGRLLLVDSAEEITAHLGPEPLAEDFTLDVFRARLADRRGAIKPLLLDQRFVAGIGNIYADEALWSAGIDPRRKVDTLKPDEVARLYAALRSVLLAGIEHQGASVNWYRKPDGTTGEQQHHFNVYDRTGKLCPRCGAVIQKFRLGQRGTHYCPSCQR